MNQFARKEYLVADWAVERVIGQQELHDALARLLDHRRVGEDLHPGHRRVGARRDRLRRLLDLDQAHAAVARDREALVEAEPRHVDADRFTRLGVAGGGCGAGGLGAADACGARDGPPGSGWETMLDAGPSGQPGAAASAPAGCSNRSRSAPDCRRQSPANKAVPSQRRPAQPLKCTASNSPRS